MKGFFPAVAKASEGETSTTPSWVKVKREKAETLAKISELSAVAFNAQHGDLAALVDLNPVKVTSAKPRELSAPAKKTSALLRRGPTASAP